VSTPKVRLSQGDARHLDLPDNSVHCVVTSPPYWGLRKYAGEQVMVWQKAEGGRQKAECEHEWSDERKSNSRIRNGEPGGLHEGRQTNALTETTLLNPATGSTCLKCGAWRGAFGLEPTIEMYVEHSIEILREIRRVLRADGVCFWNIGDCYQSGNRGASVESDARRGDQGGSFQPGNKGAKYIRSSPNRLTQVDLKPKDLCLIPARVALAAQADGWWVRSDIIWAKPNPMPESVSGWRWEKHRIKMRGKWRRPGQESIGANTDNGHGATISDRPQTEWVECPGCEKCDRNGGLVLRQGSWRPTDAYEHILMLTKSENYFCDAEAVRESLAESTLADKRNATGRHTQGSETYGVDPTSPDCPSWYRSKTFVNPESGRNLRNVWTFATQPYKGAHFATFPEELVRRCIAAGTSERGCCPQCGAPWVRIIERKRMVIRKTEGYADASGNRTATAGTMLEPAESETLGWRASCSCPTPESRVPSPAVVLDPFAGSGTVGEVAYKMGRSAVLIDLAYQELQRERIPPMALI